MGIKKSSLFIYKQIRLKIISFYKNIIIFLLLAALKNAAAVTPLYTLKVQNVFKTGPNSVEFDINLKHTNPDSSTFEYAAGQYFFDFNTAISNGGTFTYSLVQSDLPATLQPRNPTVFVSGGEKQLRLTINTIPPPGSGYIVSSTAQGTRIVRMKLQTSALYFDTQFFQLRWRNGPSNPYTKIFAFINSVLTEITTPQTHTVDSLNIPLPVELSSFTSEINENNVKLQWSTIYELNNSGFEINRSMNNSDWQNISFITGRGQSDSIVSYNFSDKKLTAGIYRYRLKQFDYNGNCQYFYLSSDVIINDPDNFSLSQNYPNPFNPSTKIDYSVSHNSNIRLIIYDIQGREVKILVNEFKTSGYYTVTLDAGLLGLSSGIYFYRMEAVSDKSFFTLTKKFSFVK